MNKKRSVLFFIIFFSVRSFSQNIFYCDTTKIFQQKDTIIKSSCNYYFNFLKGTKDSVVTINSRTYTNNSIIIKAAFRKNSYNGHVKFLLGDSVLFMQGFMRNGKPDSIFTCYQIFLANYKKESYKTFYRNGLKNGEEDEYCDKGTIIYIRHYTNGILDGAYKQYDDYGNILSEGNYKMGKKIDVWHEATPEAKINIYQNYKNGELIDYKWTSNYANNKLFIEGIYDKNGKKQGLFIIYNDDGSIQRTETYKDGKRNGDFIEYFDGKPISKTKYHNDMIVK